MMNTIKEAAYPKPMARLSVTSSIKCKTLTTQSKSGRNLQSRIKNKPKEPTTAITVKFISLGRSSIFLVLKYTPTTKSMQALAQSTKIIVIEFFGRIRHQSFIRLMCTRYYEGNHSFGSKFRQRYLAVSILPLYQSLNNQREILPQPLNCNLPYVTEKNYPGKTYNPTYEKLNCNLL